MMKTLPQSFAQGKEVMKRYDIAKNYAYGRAEAHPVESHASMCNEDGPQHSKAFLIASSYTLDLLAIFYANVGAGEHEQVSMARRKGRGGLQVLYNIASENQMQAMPV